MEQTLLFMISLTGPLLILIVGISMFWRFMTKKKRQTIASYIRFKIEQWKKDRQPPAEYDERYPNGARRR